MDSRLAQIVDGKFKTGAASDAEKVAADASAIVSKLRKYQALSQVFAASGKMQATTGLEPHFDSVDDITLADMTGLVKTHFSTWNSGKLPALPTEPAPTAVAMNDVAPIKAATSPGTTTAGGLTFVDTGAAPAADPVTTKRKRRNRTL